MSRTRRLDLASMSPLSGRQLAADQMRRVITQSALFAREGDRADVMLTHYWFQLARALVKCDAREEITVLRALLENIGNSGSITASLGPDDERYVAELVSRHPVKAWQTISSLISLPMDSRGFVITHWLRGDNGFDGRNPGPMRHIPREEIWKWIAADPGRRAPYVATMGNTRLFAATAQRQLGANSGRSWDRNETARLDA